MAKKEIATVEKSALDSIFDKLIQEQNRLVPGSAAAGTEMFAAVNNWISTGSLILDTVISNKRTGGWPVGRTIELFGEESIGKSTLIYSGMAGVQKQGGVAIYYDVEQAGSKEMMQACGVNLGRIIISNSTSIEEIFKTLEATLNTIIGTKELNGKPVLICMDSYAQMSTDAEIESGYEFNMNVSTKKAVQMGKALRKITPVLNKANACLIVINQTRDKIGIAYGDPTTTPGGKALKFAASVRIKLTGKTPVKIMDPNIEREYRSKVVEWEEQCKIWKEKGGSKGTGEAKPSKPLKPHGDEIIVGYDLIARTEKNKLAPPKREGEFRIVFLQGVVEEPAWLDYAIKFGIVDYVNSFTYKIVDPRFADTKPFVREKWSETLADAELYDFVREGLKDGLIRSAASEPVEDNDEDEDETLDEETMMPLSSPEFPG